MNSEKKLIACSILAIVIGISSVLPLTFLMSETALAETTIVKTTIVETTIVGNPLAENPLTETPLVENQQVENPVVESPIVETTIVETTIVENTVVENPQAETTIVENLIAENPIVENMMADSQLVENQQFEITIVENSLAENGAESWLSFDMPYAYWVTYDGPLKDSPFQLPNSEMTLNNSVSDELLMALNFTLIADTTEQQADAQLEYYRIDMNSDAGFIESHYWIVGTNISSFNISSLIADFNLLQNEWFDTDTFDFMRGGGGGLILRPNWPSGVSMLLGGGSKGSGTITNNGSSTSRAVSALRAAETITISTYRVGFVTFSGNTIVVTRSNNELLNEIQLEKYGEEGWLYNNLIPEDELETVDLTSHFWREES